ncbi:MAG: sensor domain-containing diguanylate cyclase [Chitinivibrionia bacterium]|nr:sensor domain-containing diguanylate cyclase [Chitinivibrionia bacterium]
MKEGKNIRIYDIQTYIKEHFLLFFLLAAFNGFHMWIYQVFVNNGMVETHLRIVIILMVLYVLVAAGIITALLTIVRRYLLTSLKDICIAVQKIADGDFSIRIASRFKKNKKDFIDLLYDNINVMTEKLASANEKLKALSVTDELTKLNNRRSFLNYMEIIWKQSHTLRLPISVLMIDVDYFKKYNDSLGHLEGDKALVAIAQCLKNNIKKETDFVARFGGEEFVCLFPFIEKDEALNFAESLVKSVEDMKIPHPMSEHSNYVTISAGMAITVPDDNNSPTKILDEADKALYTAKQSGRNRVVTNYK